MGSSKIQGGSLQSHHA
jgi:hypothetical protein